MNFLLLGDDPQGTWPDLHRALTHRTGPTHLLVTGWARSWSRLPHPILAPGQALPAATPDIRRLRVSLPDTWLWLLPQDPLSALKAMTQPLHEVWLSPAWLPHLAQAARSLARLADGPGMRVRQAPGQALLRPDDTVREAMRREGFRWVADQAWWVFEPRHLAPRPAGRLGAPAHSAQHALVIGGGVAGCATAAALASSGWHCTVIDRHAGPAEATSSNPGGLYHGVIHQTDGAHARFFRAASIWAYQTIMAARMAGCAAGTEGVLRLIPEDAQTAEARLQALGLPLEHVSYLTQAQASALAQVSLPSGAWHMHEAGWVSPPLLSRHLLASGADRIEWRGQTDVARLERVGAHWVAYGPQGELIAQAPTAIIAHPGRPGLSHHPLVHTLDWPTGSLVWRRGQVSWRNAPLSAATSHDGPSPHAREGAWPAVPLVGSGYCLPWHQSRAVFGATNQEGALDPAVTAADHEENVARLSGMWSDPPHWRADQLQGKTGFRCATQDRLPLVGAVPDMAAWQALQDSRRAPPAQVRHVPRHEGLYTLTALGSRGIASAVIGAELLRAQLTGGPAPLPSDLVDAIDPARLCLRQTLST